MIKPVLPTLVLGSALTLLAPQVHASSIYKGVGSTYGYMDGFDGKRTASGERFNQWANTAASRYLPFGTLVRVTNIGQGRHHGKSVVVRINDRGPFARGRIIDISTAAAQTIGMDGIAPVRVEVLQWGR